MRYLSTIVVACLISCTSIAKSLDARMEKIRLYSDNICSVTNVAFCVRNPGNKENPLTMYQSMSEVDKAKISTGFIRVDFVLKPEKGSDIRCRAEFCRPELWNGRLWGVGNSGSAGVILGLEWYVHRNCAAVTTDLGTWAWITRNRVRKIWPDCVQRDFDWRATHLMCAYGRKLTKLFYGKEPRRVYFEGGSTGGRQALSEAIRFPEDFDGVIAHLPENNAIVDEAAIFHLWRATHDSSGKLLFSREQMKAIADAAVEYMRERDPAPYAGQVVADGRWSEKDIEGFIALAAKKDPALDDPDLKARLKSLYMPVDVNGRRVFNGFAPGTNHAPNMNWLCLIRFNRWLNSKGMDIYKIGDAQRATIGWDKFNEFAREEGAEYNACSPDLSRFAARGGKILITTGWEDQTIPPGPIVEYYERICSAMGGLEKTKSFCLLFCHPGSAHGGGKGRKMTAYPNGRKERVDMFTDWCEKGITPDTHDTYWVKGKERLAIPATSYPGLMVKTADGKWIRREQPRTKPTIDSFYLQCDTSPR